MGYAPPAMQEVATGLSLQLLAAISFERGFRVAIAAHETYLMCYAAVVVSARLVTRGRPQEAAVQD